MSSNVGSIGRVYFGRIREVRQSAGEYRFAIVEPLIRSSEDQSKWFGSVTRPEEEFPSRGLVFWHDAPEDLEEGSYWHFEVAEHPYYDGEDRTEAYQVSHAKPGIEVVDLRGRGSDAVVRRLVTQEGIRTDPFPLTPRVLIRIDKDSWIGPVELVRSRASRTWKIAPTENVAVLDCWHLPDVAMDRVSLDGSRYLLGPRGDLGTHAGYVNWMTDEDLAKGLLKRLRKLDKGTAEALDVTYAVFDQYVQALERADLIGHGLQQELGRKERVRELRTTIIRNKDLLEDAVSALLETEVIKKEIESRKQEIYREIRKTQEREVEIDLSIRKDELQAVEAQVTQLMQEVDRVKEEIKIQERELERRVESFRTALMERVGQLIEIPEKAFAEVAVLKALLKLDHRDIQIVAEPPAVTAPISRRDEEAPVVVLGETIEIFRELTQRLRGLGLSPTLGMHMHVAFVAGAAPILTGAKAYEALAAYANTVTAERPSWVPVAGSTYEPQDLLGRFDPASRRIIPHPGGLLEALVPMDAKELSMVVLEGFNRAPVESYLLPLLECHGDALRPGGGRRIPLVADGLVDAAERYASVTRVAWHPGALLALVPVPGTAVLPVPSVVWRHTVLIDTNRYLDKGSARSLTEWGNVHECTRLRLDRWNELRRGKADVASEPMGEILDSVADSVSGSVYDVQQLALRLYVAARTCDLPHDPSVALVFEMLLVPLLHEEVAEVTRYISESKIAVEGVDRIAELTRSFTD